MNPWIILGWIILALFIIALLATGGIVLRAAYTTVKEAMKNDNERR